MTQIRIINPIERAFSQVPNSLWALEISIHAKAIFGFALSCRDGHVLRVAEIETVLRIGRDARRRAMKELQAVGLLRYVTTNDGEGRITTRELVIDATPLLKIACGSVVNDVETDHLPPENPTVGKSTPVGAEIHPNRGKISGAYNNTNTNTWGGSAKMAGKALAAVRPSDGGQAAKAAKAARAASSPDGVGLWDLGSYQKSCLQQGKPVHVKGYPALQPGSPQYRALAQAVAAENA